MKSFKLSLATLLLIILAATLVFAETNDESKSQNLAKQLQNPVASLISVPFQNNWYSGMGAGSNGTQYLLRLQPVVPTSFNDDYNLITRPIFSYISQKDVIGTTSQSGLGDTQVELFWSPKVLGSNGLIWGLGTVMLLPTAAEASLGTEKWGLGPAAVALKQDGPWTYGALVNHLWSVAGSNSRSNISLTFIEPFFAHSSKHGTTFTLMSEATFNWMSDQWTIPLEAGASQIIPLAGHYFQFGLMAIYNLRSPANISQWSGRFTVTLLLPDK